MDVELVCCQPSPVYKGGKLIYFFILPCPVPFASEKRAASYLDREVWAIYKARQVNGNWQLGNVLLLNDAHGLQMMLPGWFQLQSGISWRNLCARSLAVDVGTGYGYIFGNISFPYRWRESKKKNGVGWLSNSSWYHKDDANLFFLFMERQALVIVSYQETATDPLRNALCSFSGICLPASSALWTFIWKIRVSVWISLISNVNPPPPLSFVLGIEPRPCLKEGRWALYHRATFLGHLSTF